MHIELGIGKPYSQVDSLCLLTWCYGQWLHCICVQLMHYRLQWEADCFQELPCTALAALQTGPTQLVRRKQSLGVSSMLLNYISCYAPINCCPHLPHLRTPQVRGGDCHFAEALSPPLGHSFGANPHTKR